MQIYSPEARYLNPIQPPEEVSFRTWLQHDPHYFRLARPDKRNVQRVLRVLNIPRVFEKNEPEYLTHEYRRAITIRYIADTYPSQEDIFDWFGINRKMVHLARMVTQEPRARQQYEKLQTTLAEMAHRRQIRKQESATANGRRKQTGTGGTLAELVETAGGHNGQYHGA